jgi:hypothetical protein
MTGSKNMSYDSASLTTSDIKVTSVFWGAFYFWWCPCPPPLILPPYPPLFLLLFLLRLLDWTGGGVWLAVPASTCVYGPLGLLPSFVASPLYSSPLTQIHTPAFPLPWHTHSPLL